MSMASVEGSVAGGYPQLCDDSGKILVNETAQPRKNYIFWGDHIKVYCTALAQSRAKAIFRQRSRLSKKFLLRPTPTFGGVYPLSPPPDESYG